MCATLTFFTVLIGLSAAGQLNFLEESHQEADFSHGLQFGVLGLSSAITGGLIGNKMPEKLGLNLIVGLDIWIVSTAVFMFFVSFTGKWHVILIIAAVMTTSCLYVSLYPSFENQIKIQATSCLGAYSLMRGVAMLTGGYPAEGQMYMWIWNGQILQ